ncbi:TPA: type-F conjugative transfer system pilin assembly protein TrbC [Enterobacter roggenkampii]
MKRGITRLVLSVFLICGGAAASGEINTPENRLWLKEQENLSEQLRRQDNAPLRQMLEQKIRQNPLSEDDRRFIGNLKDSQQKEGDRPVSGAAYFVSFSIPEEGLRRMLGETRRFGIPATLRGMADNSLPATVQRVMALVKDGEADGVQIDPTLFTRYGIRTVPALVVFCDKGHDVIRGNIRLQQALDKVAAQGECRDVAAGLIRAAGTPSQPPQ